MDDVNAVTRNKRYQLLELLPRTLVIEVAYLEWLP